MPDMDSAQVRCCFVLREVVVVVSHELNHPFHLQYGQDRSQQRAFMDFSSLQLLQQQLPSQQQHLPSPWTNNAQQASHPVDQQLSSAGMPGEHPHFAGHVH